MDCAVNPSLILLSVVSYKAILPCPLIEFDTRYPRFGLSDLLFIIVGLSDLIVGLSDLTIGLSDLF